MQFVRLVFGPHDPIAELFRQAGKAVAPTHPIWAPDEAAQLVVHQGHLYVHLL